MLGPTIHPKITGFNEPLKQSLLKGVYDISHINS